MLVTLPLAGYILFFFVFRMQRNEWREAVIHAATVWGVLVVVLTEVLSLPHWLTRVGLSATWAVIDLTVLLYLWYKTRQEVWKNGGLRFPMVFPQTMLRLNEVDIGLLVGSGIIVTLVGATALLSPPNTWDAMDYHMPRIVYWIQNRSVAFYPTYEFRQLHMAPGAEFIMLHLHALLGGDRFDNLAQWFSYLGSIAGVTLVAQYIGASSRGQVFTAVLCATIPQGILYASGPKNDYVLTFWLIAFTCHLFVFEQKPNLVNALGVGSALGLAWLTKSTAYIFSAPIFALWVLKLSWKIKIKTLRYSLIIFTSVILLNIGFFARNYSFFGSPVSSGYLSYLNDDISFSAFISNVIRNIALHAGTPSYFINRTSEKLIKNLIYTFGGDPDDPRTTFLSIPFSIPEMSKHESTAGNPFHLFLIILTLVLIMSQKYIRESKDLIVYTTGLVVAFFLFCIFLKWQPWHTRLHIPLFVLWTVSIGVVLTRIWPSLITNCLGILLLLISGPVALENQIRPLVFPLEYNVFNSSRMMNYFNDNKKSMDNYIKAAEFLEKTKCPSIGIDLYSRGHEYPLLMLLNAENEHKKIKNIGAKNEPRFSAKNRDNFIPCAVICTTCLNGNAKEKWDEHISLAGPASVFQEVIVFSALGEFVNFNDYVQKSANSYFAHVELWPDKWAGPRLVQMVKAEESSIYLTLVGDANLIFLVKPLVLTIFVDGQQVGEKQITVTAPHQFMLNVPITVPSGEHTVEIRANTWFIPDMVSNNGDLRPLSYRLMEMRFVSG